MTYIFKFISLIYPKFKINFFLFFLFTLIAILFETFSIAAIIPIIDFFSSEKNSIFEGKTDFILNFFSSFKILNYKYTIILIIFFIFLIKNLFLIFNQFWQSLFTLKIERFIASQLFKIYLNKDMMFHINTHSGTLIRNMNVEIKNVTKSISSLFIMLIEISITFTLVIILLYVSPTETFFTLFIIGASGLFIIYFTNKKIKVLSENRASIDKRYNKNLIDTFNSINDIKLMNKLNFFSVIHDKLKNKYFYNIKNFALINAFPRPLMEIIILTLIFSFIIFSLNRDININDTIATLGLFGIVGLRLLPAFSKIIVSFQNLKFRYASFQILYEELNKKIDYNENESYQNRNIKNDLFSEKINLKNISFKHGDNKIFENFNLEIKKNRLLFVYGESGAGKSTLLNLIMGLIKPAQGEILLDNKHSIYDNIGNWRNIVSYVPQHLYLLDETIEKNIAFGEKVKDIDYEKLKEVIKLSKLENYLNENDLNKHSLGEKGMKMSGGQIQRMGVARALYRKPKILLLDESTNGLDYETEKGFLNDLNDLKKEITIIFVSHREHIKDYADDFVEIKKLNFLRNN